MVAARSRERTGCAHIVRTSAERAAATPEVCSLPVSTLLMLLVATLVATSPLEEAQAAANEAEAAKVTGHYGVAADHMERALRLIEEAADPTIEVDMAALHLEIANLNLYAARYDRAEPHFAAALKIQEAAHGADSPELLQVLTSVATFYLSTGSTPRSVVLYERSLAIARKHHGADAVSVASIRAGLGAARAHQMKYPEAREHYEFAVATLREHLGDDDPNVVTARSGLASVYDGMGEPERAQEQFQAVLDWRKRAQGAQHPQTALAMNNLAYSLYMSGRYAKATPVSREALRVTEAALGDHHPQTSMLRNTLAFVLEAQGKTPDALALLESAARSADLLLRSARLQATGQRMEGFLQMWRWQETVAWAMAHAHPRNPRALRLAMAAALLRKGRSIDEAADLSRAVLRGLSPGDQRKFNALKERRAKISGLAQSGPQGADPAAWSASFDALVTQAEAEEQSLARSSAALRATQLLPGPDDVVERVADALPKGSALVEYVAFQPVDFAPRSRDKAWAPMHYTAAVLRSDGTLGWADVGAAEEVDAAVTAHLAWAAQAENLADDTGPAQALYKLLMRNVGPLLGKARRVFVAPEGQLHLVPFSALHDGTAYLLDRATVTIVGSGRDLLRPRGTSTDPGEFVVVADPDFGGVAGWEPLPATGDEAKAIAGLMASATVVRGAAADPAAVLGAKAPGVLHIASHGAFRGGADARGPLLDSGLVLAGAREASALEIAGMDLWGTRLVVLSACETARGEIKRGDGVHGLRRAFQIAGAETVVASLWRVDDAVTRDLMVRFYKGLLAGRGRAEALRAAMLAVRQQHPQPYYWAPFIQLGEGGPLPLNRATK